MSKINILTNKRFGRLLVIKRADDHRHGRLAWQCKCDCGKYLAVTDNALVVGNTTSCGCRRFDTFREKRTPVAERLKSKVAKPNRRGCVLWRGAVNANGYGSILDEVGRIRTVSRVAYEVAFGPFPESMHVLHHCDTPLCVNPEHLYLGGNKENVRDKVLRGRAAHKLTVKKVRAIRAAIARGETQKSIADRFGVCQAQISLINTRKQWKHIV